MTKAKLIRLKNIISRINDPTLKQVDKLRETASLPGIDLQQFLNVCRDIGKPLETLVPADQVNKVGEQLMQACRLNKIDSSDFESITARVNACRSK